MNSSRMHATPKSVNAHARWETIGTPKLKQQTAKSFYGADLPVLLQLMLFMAHTMPHTAFRPQRTGVVKVPIHVKNRVCLNSHEVEGTRSLAK